MATRHKLSKRGSRKLFTATARTKRLNLWTSPMRGGYRL